MDRELEHSSARVVANERQQASDMAFGLMVFAIAESVVLSILFTTLLNQVGMVELGSYIASRNNDTFVVSGFLSVPAALALFAGIELSFVACRMASRHNNDALFLRLGVTTLVFLVCVSVLLPVGMTAMSDTLTGTTTSPQPAPIVELLKISRGG